jgi:signal transduction histidine kinase
MCVMSLRENKKPFRKSEIGKLRWQLAFRFAGVTVATLLLVVLGLGGFLFSQILVTNWRLSPATWIEVANRTAVPTTRRIITEDPKNRALITMWLSFVANPTSIFRLMRFGDAELTLRTTGSAVSFLFDDFGVLMGSSDTVGFEWRIGERFTPEIYPAVADSVTAALHGETDPELLVRPSDEETGSFSVAIPIYTDGQNPEKLIGVLAVNFGPLSANSKVAHYTLRLALVSLLILLILTGAVAVLFAFLTARSLTSRLGRFSTIADRWSEGDFTQSISDDADDELGVLARRLDSMATEMNKLLGQREKMAISQERNRMARDLHDSVKQQALAAALQIGTALSLVNNDTPAATRHMEEADKLLDDVRVELASLIDGEYTTMPESGDAAEVLRAYLDSWSDRSGIAVSIDISNLSILDHHVWTALFRITQEALSNIARHSGASDARLDLTQRSGDLVLVVSDNGSGFDVSASHSGMGLRSMRERCEQLQGVFAVESSPADGTYVCATVPQGSTP